MLYEKMSSFIFFLLLTMTMAFLLNWVFMQYFYTCTDCSHAIKHIVETEKLAHKLGATTECEDMEAFLDGNL